MVHRRRSQDAQARRQVHVHALEQGHVPARHTLDGKKVDDVGVHNKAAVAPGKTASFSVTFPAAGTYKFYCAIKGHAAKGMKGTVKVT